MGSGMLRIKPAGQSLERSLLYKGQAMNMCMVSIQAMNIISQYRLLGFVLVIRVRFGVLSIHSSLRHNYQGTTLHLWCSLGLQINLLHTFHLLQIERCEIANQQWWNHNFLSGCTLHSWDECIGNSRASLEFRWHVRLHCPVP